MNYYKVESIAKPSNLLYFKWIGNKYIIPHILFQRESLLTYFN